MEENQENQMGDQLDKRKVAIFAGVAIVIALAIASLVVFFVWRGGKDASLAEVRPTPGPSPSPTAPLASPAPGRSVIVVVPPGVTPVIQVATPTPSPTPLPTSTPWIVDIAGTSTPIPSATPTQTPAPTFTPAPAMVAITTMTVQVVVNRCNGQGVEGARLVIWDGSKQTKIGEGITDASGVVKIYGVTPGMAFVAEVFATGYPTPVYPVQYVPQKQDPSVQFRLQRC